MAFDRSFSLKILATQAPQTITVNGKPVEYSYSGEELAVYIEFTSIANGTVQTIQIRYPESQVDFNGLYGKARRIGKAMKG